MAIIHAADCGVPLVNRNLKLSLISTLEGSLLTLTCEIEMSLNSTTETTLSVTCHSNGSWIPDQLISFSLVHHSVQLYHQQQVLITFQY